MSDTKTRMPLAVARAKAEELVAILRPVTERCEIAGSIRRKKPDCGDLEVVCIPKTETRGSLFDGDGESHDLLSEKVWGMIHGRFEHRLDKNGRQSYGPKYKRLLFDGVPLDLFSTTTENWGLIFTIRTGPAEFSHTLVTPQIQGGKMPKGMCCNGGALRLRETNEAIACWEEADLFRAIGLPWIEPEDRR